MSDFWELACLPPDGFPFFREAEKVWAAGEAAFVKTCVFTLDTYEITQEWTLRRRPEYDSPGAFDQTVYEKLQEYRREIGAADERTMRFAIEEFSEFVFGSQGPAMYDAILASIKRIWACYIDLLVNTEDGRGLRSGGNPISGFGTAEHVLNTGERIVDVEIRFWDKLLW